MENKKVYLKMTSEPSQSFKRNWSEALKEIPHIRKGWVTWVSRRNYDHGKYYHAEDNKYFINFEREDFTVIEKPNAKTERLLKLERIVRNVTAFVFIATIIVAAVSLGYAIAAGLVSTDPLN